MKAFYMVCAFVVVVAVLKIAADINSVKNDIKSVRGELGGLGL